MRIPWYVAWPVILLAAYAGLALFARRATYYPVKYPRGHWDAQQGLGAEDVWLRTSDNLKLHAWRLAADGSPVVTLFLHGNGGNLTHRVGHLQEIRQAGSSVLILDYRGYGRSQGSPSERGLYRDAEAAYDHLLSGGCTPSQIVLHGESLGTAVAVELASRRPCGGMILEAPFTSAAAVAHRVLPFVGPMIARGFDSKRRIAAFTGPLLIIHGDRDEVIPLSLGRSLFQAANEPKQFWEVPGAGHNDIVEAAGIQYRQRLAEFYARLRP